jgi:hypothetical protein
MNLFHFLFLYLRGKEKESGVKKKKARHRTHHPHCVRLKFLGGQARTF